jgi:hypothetical protein
MTRLGFGVAVLAGAFVARAPSLGRGLFDPDEAAIATMGMVVARGGVLYRDVIDRKPPLAPLLYALSFWVTGSRHLQPLHVVAALELGGAAVVVASEVRRRAGRRAAWWAAGLFLAGAVALRPADAQAANYSHLALLPACGAIVAARRGSVRSALAAGALLGLATLTRQTWIIGLFPAALAVWLHGERRDRWRRVAIVVASTAATIGAVALVVSFGPFLHWTFSGNGSLLFDLSQVQRPLGRGLGAIETFVIGHAVLCAFLLVRRWHRQDLDLWLWLLTGLAAVVAGFRYFGHYWLQVLPPLCLLAAPAIASCRAWTRVALAALAVVPTFLYWQQAWVPTHGSSNVDRRVFPLVAEVRQRTTLTDRITVWGSLPEVYWLSGRAPAGALVITDFLVGRTRGRPDGPQRLRDATPGALHDFLASLEARPPKLFLDTSTGRLREYDHYPLTLVPSVHAFVARRYRPIGVVQGVAVYEVMGAGNATGGAARGASRPSIDRARHRAIRTPKGSPGTARG